MDEGFDPSLMGDGDYWRRANWSRRLFDGRLWLRPRLWAQFLDDSAAVRQRLGMQVDRQRNRLSAAQSDLSGCGVSSLVGEGGQFACAGHDQP